MRRGRSLSDSRFSSSAFSSEDVNPSAYIVNLADCMLVLACGFMVAMISYWNIDVSSSTTQLEEEELVEVDPEILDEDLLESGSVYNELGVVYQDPSTGALYMVIGSEVTISTEDSDSSDVGDAADSDASTSTQESSTSSTSQGEDESS